MKKEAKTQENQSDKATSEIISIPIAKIATNPNQPRKIFAESAILRLADSIKRYGIIQPLVVRETSEGYELISGERRLRASCELGFTHVPCVIRGAKESESAEIAIIENLMREDLSPFEEAEAIQALIDTYSLTQEEIASKLSCSQSYVANKLRLLRLDKETRNIITKNNLTERHARALLRLKDEERLRKALHIILEGNLNVSQAEALVERFIAGESKKEATRKTYKSTDAFFDALNRAIETASNSGIKIKSRKIEGDGHIEMTILVPTVFEEVEK